MRFASDTVVVTDSATRLVGRFALGASAVGVSDAAVRGALSFLRSGTDVILIDDDITAIGSNTLPAFPPGTTGFLAAGRGGLTILVRGGRVASGRPGYVPR